MRNFITTIIRGFGWGLGFSIAFLLSISFYQTYFENPPQKVKHTWPDDEFSKSEKLSPKELEGLLVTVSNTRMIEGKIIVSGTIENKIERDAYWVEVVTKVSNNGEIIEICKSENRGRINVGSKLEFLTFCDSKWNTITLEDVQIETIVARASTDKEK